MEERLSADPDRALDPKAELLVHVRAGVATVTLNRPAALNALTFGMLTGLTEHLGAWANDASVKVVVLRGAGDKAFCAGGDIRVLHDRFRSGATDLLDFFTVEYALDYRIHSYPKPIVAVLDGIVMGGGMGISQGAALRIAGERTKMAMPETAIGLFPDVGGSYFLSHAPGRLGVYLGLVGPTIRAADCIYCGLADTSFGPASLESLDRELEAVARSSDPRAAVVALETRFGTVPANPPELEALRPAIDLHFGQPTVVQILASLETEQRPEYAPWARKTREALAKRSPTMLVVALEQLKRGATMTLAECFRMELGMIEASFAQGDFIEGIRALVVDKDNAPRWNPPALEAVGAESVARFFASRWTDSRHPLASLGRNP